MDVKPGRYRHYRGNEYEVIGVGRMEDSHEPMVIYRALYKSEKFGDNAIWVRPLSVFIEKVEFEGKLVPRFAPL
jgi:hypothetical protein